MSLAYYHFKVAKVTSGFPECLDRMVHKGGYRNYDLYAIDGKIAADVVLRYESLQADLSAVLARLSLPTDAQLPKAKSHFRDDRRPAREILSRDQKRFIRTHCDEEFVAFGYEE